MTVDVSLAVVACALLGAFAAGSPVVRKILAETFRHPRSDSAIIIRPDKRIVVKRTPRAPRAVTRPKARVH